MRYNYKPEGYLRLLPACQVFAGPCRAVVVNAGAGTFEVIPLQLKEIIELGNSATLSEIYDQYGPKNKPVIDSYFDFLVSGGFAFISDSLENPMRGEPVLYESWDTPYMFSNAIVDFNGELEVYYLARIKELGALGCNMLQLRFFQEQEYYQLEQVVEQVYALRLFNGLSIVADATCFPSTDEASIEALIVRCPIVNEVILYNSTDDCFYDNKQYRFKVLQLTAKLDEKSCGAVLPFYFATNISSFSESFSHNTCLNRKIGIDVKGNIKNCPSMVNSFGNIVEATLTQAIEHPEFKKLWFITKDQVSKCQTCEFRKICTDCRAYLDNPEDPFSAPLKCGYDPLTCTWEKWSDHPLKQQAIRHYELTVVPG